ncbi:MAG: hypothetical protein HS108_10385 [Planctomycetes bacterium]|jgi:hypothetical protein|nr:hypothetical protein [Planctomycetota bacterium]MCL4729223.1 hypothetical protein [Planctomycetota bacterium]
MRFLDRRWARGSLSDFEVGLHHQVYLRHLESIADDLPRKLKLYAGLSSGTGLSGARLIKARLNRARRTLRVVLQLPPMGKTRVKARMLFSRLDVESLDVRAFKRVCARPESLCVADEVDLAPGGLYEHRMLFEPEGETAVRFGRFQMELEELPPGHEEPHGGWREDG